MSCDKLVSFGNLRPAALETGMILVSELRRQTVFLESAISHRFVSVTTKRAPLLLTLCRMLLAIAFWLQNVI